MKNNYINKIKVFFVLFFLLQIFTSYSQTLQELQDLEKKIPFVNDKEKAVLWSKLATGYLNTDVKKSLSCANIALNYAKKTNHKEAEAEAYSILGAISFKNGDNKKAAEYYENELKLRKNFTDKQYLARSYFNLASIFRWLDKTKKAIENYESSLAISKQHNFHDLIYQNYEALFGAYYEKNKFKEAFEYFKLYIALRDTAFKLEKTKQINILSSKYETVKSEVIRKESEISQKETELKTKDQELNITKQEKETLKVQTVIKDKQIEQLNYEKAFKEEELKNKELQRNFLLAGSVLTLIILFLILFQYIQKRKANKKLSLQNQQILQQKEEIEAQRDEIEAQRDNLSLLNEELKQQKEEIEAQRDELSEKNHLIAEKNEEITKSIHYALRIQQAILPPTSEIAEFFPNSFVLYKPKDIVSGDFYWYDHFNSNGNEIILLAAADCTGHGVPGAFMSMIGIEILSNVTKETTKPHEVLAKLNHGMKIALRQTEDHSSTRDGMDIALCAFDLKNKQIYYSGANRPLWIIKKDAEEVTEIKATKKAIGGFTEADQIFESNTIQYETGDSFYIFSDGYVDQFGGENGRKLMTKKFKELLLNIKTLEFNKQEKYLDDYFEKWKGVHHQIDDVMVLGIKL